jgi:hypothetical protein
MLKLSELASIGGRPLRQDDPSDLGKPTPEAICDAIDEGRLDEAKALSRYMIDEGRSLHALFCDCVWDLLTLFAEEAGEECMIENLKASQSGWMMYRTWKGFLRLSVEERVQVTSEIMRSHYCGPGQDGEIEVVDRGNHFAIVMDPCGSGGRMRRGDPVEQSPSRLKSPYKFGKTSKSYPESWGKTGVPYYCIHCAHNEILSMEFGEYPLWVTGYQDDANKPCEWRFYKNPEDIPKEYFERVGRRKPRSCEGKY